MKKSISTLLLFLVSTCAIAGVQVNYMYQRNASCDSSGVIAVYGSGGNGTYSYKWSTGHTATGAADSITNLREGIYRVTCYSGVDSAKTSFHVYAFGIDTVFRRNACFGELGWINLFAGLSGYTWPLHTQWYLNGDSLAHDELELDSLHAGLYSYYLVDGKGCEISGTVKIGESSPVFNVYTNDTVVCYNGTLTLWYTPGFTLWNGEYFGGSSNDTAYAFNSLSGLHYATCGMDTAGCLACDDTLPDFFVIGHPSNLTLQRYGDTVSIGYPDTNVSTTYTYGWGTPHGYEFTGYNFYIADTVGNYFVTQHYKGCPNATGNINVSYLPVPRLSPNASGISISPNPATNYITITAPPQLFNQTIQVYDVTGRLIDEIRITQTKQEFNLTTFDNGTYFIKLFSEIFILLKI